MTQLKHAAAVTIRPIPLVAVALETYHWHIAQDQIIKYVSSYMAVRLEIALADAV